MNKPSKRNRKHIYDFWHSPPTWADAIFALVLLVLCILAIIGG